MSDSPEPFNTDTRAEAKPPGVPRWLKLSAVVLAIAIVALVVTMLLIGGQHGPGGHG